MVNTVASTCDEGAKLVVMRLDLRDAGRSERMRSGPTIMMRESEGDGEGERERYIEDIDIEKE